MKVLTNHAQSRIYELAHELTELYDFYENDFSELNIEKVFNSAEG